MGKGTFGCVKWLLTFFNFLFLICGLAICGLGVWMLVSPSTINDLMGKNLTPVISYILLGIGGTIILISFCGCAGAGLENRCLLCLFFTVLCGIFVACLVASILIAVFKKDLDALTNERLSENLISNYGSSLPWTEFWDGVQTRFMCCGVNNDRPTIMYQKTAWYQTTKKQQLPLSCCIKNVQGSYVSETRCQNAVNDSYHNTGCLNALKGYLVRYAIAVIIVLISVALVLILGMVLSLAHLRNIINSRYIDYSQPI